MPELRNKSLDTRLESPSAMDPEGFAAQYSQAYPRLHLIAMGIIGDRTYAHDVVQDAAVIALEKSSSFIAGSNFVAWLSEIVRRCSLNYASKIRGRRTTAVDPDVFAQFASSQPSRQAAWSDRSGTGELVDFQTDFDDATWHALKKIPTDARCCLLLRVVQNLSYAEISELMEIPEGTAMSHVYRSKKQLRQSLQQRATEARIPDDRP
jgi:RNA polymerase sigma-70 factor (ECF subfamily)